VISIGLSKAAERSRRHRPKAVTFCSLIDMIVVNSKKSIVSRMMLGVRRLTRV